MLGLGLGLNKGAVVLNRPLLQQIPDAVAGLGLNRLNSDVVSYSNLVTNGDFSDGTTGWNTQNATNNVSNLVLSNTGDGSTSLPRLTQLTSHQQYEGKKVFMRATVRVTNPDCTSIALAFVVSSTSRGTYTGDRSVNNPVQNQWYTLSGFITFASGFDGSFNTVLLQHVYGSSEIANGKTLEVLGGSDGILYIPVSGTRYENYTADEMNSAFPFTPATGKAIVPQKPIRVYRDSDSAETDIGLIGSKLDTASLLSFAGDLSYTNLESNGDFSNGLTGWTIGTGAVASANSGVVTFTTLGTSGYELTKASGRVPTTIGEKYYISAELKSNSTSDSIFVINPPTSKFHSGSNSFERLSLVFTATTTATDYRYLDSTRSGDISASPVEVKNCMFVKMTGTEYEHFTAEQMDAKFPFVATTGVATVSAYVTKIYDQSNNGNNAIQSVASNCPRIVNNGVLEVDSNGDVSVYYDGVDDRFDITDNQGLDITSGGLSLVAKFSNKSQAYLISRNEDSLATVQYTLLAGVNGDVVFYLNGSGIVTDTTLLLSEKITVATYDDVNVKIYLDGIIKNSNSYSTPLTSRPNIQIGCRSNSVDGTIKSVFYKGHITSIIVFNRAITQAEVTKLNKL